MVRRIPASEPAPTLGAAGLATGRDRWTLRSGNTINGGDRAERQSDEPSVTVTSRADNCEWVESRPATTVAGDPRIAQPDSPGRMENAVRVTVEEASILQSFDPAYPWQGSRSAQFQQIGNAVPPLLARAVLAALTEGVDVGSDCIDLFAGPGGWDVGARDLGIDPLGVEYDDNACATRNAAGLRTLQGDVSALDPNDVAAMAADVPEPALVF